MESLREALYKEIDKNGLDYKKISNLDAELQACIVAKQKKMGTLNV